MEWQYIVAIVVAVPVILFPVALAWYLNMTGLLQVLADRRARQKKMAVREAKARG